jgi:hypothetical protein
MKVSAKRKQVVTVDGSTDYVKNCKLINGIYYKINDQCVLIKKRWYPTTSEEIFFDHNQKDYKLKIRSNYFTGIVDYKNDEFVVGYYTMNVYKNCRVGITQDGEKIYMNCMDYNIPKSIGYIEHINEGLWADENFSTKDIVMHEIHPAIESRVAQRLIDGFNADSDFKTIKLYKFSNNSYNAEESFMFDIKKHEYEKYQTPLSKDVRRAAKLIGDLSFGCEIETKKGMIQDYYQSQLGIVICKDGSIGYTPEFVTVPYKGAKGLQSIKDLFTELNKRCTTDYTCSLHYHIGTVRKDREFIVALFKLYTDIQHDLHKMLPYYKTDPDGVKEKNYCQFLNSAVVKRSLLSNVDYKSKVKNSYSSIFNWILDGRSPDKQCNRKTKRHPNGQNKWSRGARYTSLNLMNMFLSDRQTVEFRAHHAILSPDKAINWLFICVAIVRYAEQNSSKLVSDPDKRISLEEVLMYYGNTFKTEYAKSVSKYLIGYYNNRVQYFDKLHKNGDNIAEDDYLEKDFSFSHEGMKGLY